MNTNEDTYIYVTEIRHDEDENWQVGGVYSNLDYAVEAAIIHEYHVHMYSFSYQVNNAKQAAKFKEQFDLDSWREYYHMTHRTKSQILNHDMDFTRIKEYVLDE